MALNPETYKRMSKKEKLQAIADGKISIVLSQEEAKELLFIYNELEELAVATEHCLLKMKDDDIELTNEDKNLLERSEDLVKSLKTKIQPIDLSWLND